MGTGLAGAHSAHSSQLTPLNKALAGVQLSGWIPTHIEGGFNGLIDSLKETNAAITAEHDLLSKRIKEEVCPPIKKAKADLDLKRREIEKEAKGMPEAVLKEREATNAALLALSEACSSIVPLQPAQDPVLLRYAFDSQLRVQVDKENDLLVRAQRWTQDAKQVERAAFDAIAQAWSIWSEANSNMLLSNQQRSVLLSATIDSIPSDAEWNHFANPSVGQAVPLDAEPQQADEIDIPNRQDPQTEPLRQGLLERQKGWVKTWKPGSSCSLPSLIPRALTHVCLRGSMGRTDAVWKSARVRHDRSHQRSNAQFCPQTNLVGHIVSIDARTICKRRFCLCH